MINGPVMKQPIPLVRQHRKTFVLLVCAIMLILLGAGTCGTDPGSGNTTLIIFNNTSDSVKVVIHFGDSICSNVISPGNQSRCDIGEVKEFTAVAKPMGDWLSYAQAKRDRLVEDLAKAKDSGNAVDISAITSQLSDIQLKIKNYDASSQIKSCVGTTIGGTQDVSVNNSKDGDSVFVRCGGD